MNVVLNCKKTSGKGLEVVPASKEFSQALYNALVGKVVTSEEGKVKIQPVSKEERAADADNLASVWDKVVAKYPTLDTILISDYVTSHNVPATLSNGEKVSKAEAFPAKMLVKNLNMVAILTGIAADLESDGKMSATTKALYKASCVEEAEGYNKGKRGRTKKIINKEQRAASLLASL